MIINVTRGTVTGLPANSICTAQVRSSSGGGDTSLAFSDLSIPVGFTTSNNYVFNNLSVVQIFT